MDKEQTKLLACPFCDAKKDIEPDTLYPSGTTWYLHKDGFRVYGAPYKFPNQCWKLVCTCGAEVHADSKDDAIQLWNTRHTKEER